MFAVDNRKLARLEPTVRRTLIVEPNLHAARLLVDLIKGLGARDIHVEQTEAKAMTVARELDPGLIFTERGGPALDGEGFVRQLRRSHLPCRAAPVIMVTADATANTIRGARDVGVHEFLRKPFTSADLINDPVQAVRAARQQAVTLKQLAMKSSDARMAVAVSALEVALSGSTTSKASLAGPIGGLLALADPAPAQKAG